MKLTDLVSGGGLCITLVGLQYVRTMCRDVPDSEGLGQVLRDILLVLLGVMAGWAGQQFLPRLWRQASWESPIDVHVETDPRIFEAGMPDWIGYGLLFPGRPQNIPPPPERATAQEWWAWARDLGAYDGWSSKISVTITCRQNVVVAVDALSVQIVDQQPVPEGTFIVRPTGGADIVPRGVEIDLDGMGYAAVTYYRAEGGGTLPSLSFTVEPGKVERLQIEAKAGHTLCAWRAQLHLLVDGQRKTVDIDNNGQPFETAAQEGRPMYRWEDGAWRPWD